MNLPPLRLLGFAPLDGLEALRAKLAAVPGAALSTRCGAAVAAVLQMEPPVKLMRRRQKDLLSGLHTVQRRLEIACLAGPFLPMDPSAACCPADQVAELLAPSWDLLATALARHGTSHQWDVILRWAPEEVVAQRRDEIAAAAAGRGPVGMAEAVAAALRAERARREAALLAALAQAVLAVAPGGAVGTEAEIAVTVLVGAGGEACIEAALQNLDPAQFAGASADLRGPLPPLSFAPARLAVAEPGEVASAWHRLGLGENIDRAGLHAHWRQRAASAHPDRHPPAEQQAAAAALSEITRAYHLLRDLLPNPGPITLPLLLRRAGYRLILPTAAQADDAGTKVDELETLS